MTLLLRNNGSLEVNFDIDLNMGEFVNLWACDGNKYKGVKENQFKGLWELVRRDNVTVGWERGWREEKEAYWNVDGENTEDNFAWASEGMVGHKQGVCNDAARTPAETDLSDVFISYRISVTDLLLLHGWLSLYHWIASGISLIPSFIFLYYIYMSTDFLF